MAKLTKEQKRAICNTVTHGLRHIPEYHVWAAMKQRCTNPNNKIYKHYGARGIKVCDRWLNSFEAFITDMGRRPTDAHSIERVNNDGNYEPSNCIWATRAVQAKNKRDRQYLYRGNISINQCGNYCARVNIDRKTHSCGTYKTKAEAQAAINKKVNELKPKNIKEL
jgi:hypothetical protein